MSELLDQQNGHSENQVATQKEKRVSTCRPRRRLRQREDREQQRDRPHNANQSLDVSIFRFLRGPLSCLPWQACLSWLVFGYASLRRASHFVLLGARLASCLLHLSIFYVLHGLVTCGAPPRHNYLSHYHSERDVFAERVFCTPELSGEISPRPTSFHSLAFSSHLFTLSRSHEGPLVTAFSPATRNTV